jgi:hypothetical protein
MPKVISDKQSEVVKHYRTIQIEDGPTVDCGGTGQYESYFPGTLIKVDKLKLEWIGDAEPLTVEASGPYVGEPHDGKSRYNRRYPYGVLPEWIRELL